MKKQQWSGGQKGVQLTSRLLLLALLFSALVTWTEKAEGSHESLLVLWNDQNRSHAVVDPSMMAGQRIVFELNLTSTVEVNGFDITTTHNATVLTVSAPSRLSFEGDPDSDIVLSSTVPRRPIASELSTVLLDPGPLLRYIDGSGLDSFLGSFGAGETLVYDGDNSLNVTAGDTIVSSTVPRSPNIFEMGLPLLQPPSFGLDQGVGYVDLNPNLSYDTGETLVKDEDFSGDISLGFLPVECPWFEGCLFDQRTSGSPIGNRNVQELARTSSLGSSRLALVLLGRPLLTGNGTLYRVQFQVATTGSTQITISQSTITTILPGGLGSQSIPHTTRSGFFSNRQPVHEIAVVHVHPTPDRVLLGQTVNVTVVLSNPGTEDETAAFELRANTTLLLSQPAVLARGSTSTILYEWNTSLVAGGTYILNGTLLLASDEFLADNTYTSPVRVVDRDIAINSLALSQNNVPSGNIVNITASIQNLGTETETFNLTIYRDSSLIDRRVLTFPSGLASPFLFEWNTTSSPQGPTNIVANLTRLQNETNIPNNEATVTITFSGTNSAPRGTFTISPPNPASGQNILFDASEVQDPDLDIITSYSWNFGDGQFASGRTTSHTYQSHGTYTVTLKALDSRGLAGRISQSLSVAIPPLAVTPTANPDRGEPPLTVVFGADISGGLPSYIAYWDFGDGQFSTSLTASHTYTGCGSYTAVLTVDDSAFHRQTETIQITLLVSYQFRVLDLSGSPLPATTITILAGPMGQQSLTTVTGSDGTASFQQILEGNYSIRLTAQGHMALDTTFQAVCGGQNTVTLALFPEPAQPRPDVSQIILYAGIVSAVAALVGVLALRQRSRRRVRQNRADKRQKRK